MRPINPDISDNGTRLELEPDAEHNIFVSQEGGVHIVARTVIITGLPVETIREVVIGNYSALDPYVVADDEQPHLHRIVDCHAAMNIDTPAAHGINSFVEFTPLITEKAAAQ